MSIIRRAVCLLTVNSDGKILAVSRKNDPDKMGLPGGKIDPGESELEALIREVKEETGLDLIDGTIEHNGTVARPVKTFTDICHGDVDYECVTYYTACVSGNLFTNEPIVIAWVAPEVLIAGPFGEYNKKLFTSVGIKYDSP